MVFGAVHHLTVASYFLQHPLGYGTEILAAWRAVLADTLDGRASPSELQRRHARQFRGARRVRDPDAAVPPYWPRSWSITVRDVLNPLEPLPGAEDYIARAMAWAAATRAALDTTDSPASRVHR